MCVFSRVSGVRVCGHRAPRRGDTRVHTQHTHTHTHTRESGRGSMQGFVCFCLSIVPPGGDTRVNSRVRRSFRVESWVSGDSGGSGGGVWSVNTNTTTLAVMRVFLGVSGMGVCGRRAQELGDTRTHTTHTHTYLSADPYHAGWRWWWWFSIMSPEGTHGLTVEPVGVFLMIAKCQVVVADSGRK